MIVPSMTNCLGLSTIGSSTSAAESTGQKKKMNRSEEADQSEEESLCSSERGGSQNIGVRKRDVKRQIKDFQEPLVFGYRQVNYMHMLNEIISNDFIDDRLTQFLNILQDDQLKLQVKPQSPILTGSKALSSVGKRGRGAESTTALSNSIDGIQQHRKRRLLSYFLDSMKEINEKFDGYEHNREYLDNK